MNPKKRKSLAEKISDAQRRRRVFGLTARQLNDLYKQHDLRKFPSKAVTPKGSRKKALSANRTVPPNFSSIFLSGGIGDVLAIESFMADRERALLKTIFYGTNKRKPVETMWKALPNFPLLTSHVTVWDDFSQFWCFYSKDDCLNKIKSKRMMCPPAFYNTTDFSILPMFREIKSEIRKFTGSSFLKHEVAKLDEFDLPESYFVICPYSTDKRIKNRDFDKLDWDACFEILRLTNSKGVVLNNGNDNIPVDENIVNLNNSTTLTQSIEILKKAKGYIGIDSALSVLAAQLFNYPNLLIKSNNEHCIGNKKCYYPTQRDKTFLFRAVRTPAEFHS